MNERVTLSNKVVLCASPYYCTIACGIGSDQTLTCFWGLYGNLSRPIKLQERCLQLMNSFDLNWTREHAALWKEAFLLFHGAVYASCKAAFDGITHSAHSMAMATQKPVKSDQTHFHVNVQ